MTLIIITPSFLPQLGHCSWYTWGREAAPSCPVTCTPQTQQTAWCWYCGTRTASGHPSTGIYIHTPSVTPSNSLISSNSLPMLLTPFFFRSPHCYFYTNASFYIFLTLHVTSAFEAHYSIIHYINKSLRLCIRAMGASEPLSLFIFSWGAYQYTHTKTME